MPYKRRVLALFTLLLVGSCAARLQFKTDGSFKILQFTDFHFGEDDSRDEKSMKITGKILDAEKPDLVVITGDLVSGYMWDRKPGFFEKHWAKAIKPIVERNVSYAFATGNHDIEADLSGTQIVQLENRVPQSLTQHGPPGVPGSTNYYLPIYSSSTSDNIGSVVWVFDSGHDSCVGVSGWGCIETGQVDWYRNASASLSPSGSTPIPGYAFFHIPLYEHLDLWNSKEVKGEMEDEGVCCSSLNTGLYVAMRERNDMKAVFVGHDHNNDYYGDYYGITLGYGRKSGYGGYGPPLGWKRGGRVIELYETKPMKTWLRLEDGSTPKQSKQRAPTSYKLYGCCGMEGHGFNTRPLTASLIIILVVPILFAMKTLISCVQKKRSYSLISQDEHGIEMK